MANRIHFIPNTDYPAGPLQEMLWEQEENTKRWFPRLTHDLRHMALGLAGEAGEVVNLIKKLDRGDFELDDITDGNNVSVTKRDLIAEEVADVLIYALNIWCALGVDPDRVLREKNEYNELRFGKGKKP